MNSYNGFTPQERQAAFDWLKVQGLPAPTHCQVCGQTEGPIAGHSEDYSRPYGPHIGEYSLCYICHMMIHCRFKSPEAWLQYKRDIAEGFRYQQLGKNWPLFAANFLSKAGIKQPKVQGRIPPYLWLEKIEQHGASMHARNVFNAGP